MGKILKYNLLCLILLPSFVAGQTIQKNATVSGSVINGSLTAPAAGVEVVLYALENGREIDKPRPHTMTDSRGRFIFKNLVPGAKRAYYPKTLFRGFQYSGPVVQLGQDSLQQQSDITVFETTNSDSAIVARMHHIIIEPAAGMLAVREVYQYLNRGKYTYVDHSPADKKTKIGLQFEIPQQAKDLQVGGNLMSCCAIVEENKIYDTMEFKPGNKQVVLNYNLPYSGSTTDMRKTIKSPTDLLDVYLPAQFELARLSIANGSSPVEKPVGKPFQLRGKNYNRYVLANVKKAGMLTLGLRRLPTPPMDLRWFAPAALLSIILAGYVFYRMKLKSETVPAEQVEKSDDPVAKRQTLMEKIIVLNHEFETGALEKEIYLAEREKLIEQVMELDTIIED